MSQIKQAFRQLRLQPGMSVVVILMLALGLGATTAMFSLFHQILSQPLAVPEPERLVNLGAPGPKPGGTSCSNIGACEYTFSYPMFRDLEAEQDVFTGLAAHIDFTVNLSHEGESLAGAGLLVSRAYFDVLNVEPAVGRLLGPQDAPRVDESPVVVLTHDYWQSYFGGDPDVVGETLTVNGRRLTIVGVAPEGFEGTTIGNRPRVFVPLTLRWLMDPTLPRAEIESRRSYWLYLFARLKPGASIEQASAGINPLYGGILNDIEAPLQSGMPADRLEEFRQRRITLEPGAQGQSQVPAVAGQPLTMLLGITVLVLLIVCVNIANLLLARGASRAGEMAVRASIGASRGRLVRQLLTEAAGLALVGGLLSVPVAQATLLLLAVILPGEVSEVVRIELDSTALGFAAGASLTTVMLFGLVPALKATRADPGLVVKGHGSRTVGGRGAARFRSVLGTIQIAFSMLLLVLAGLFTQSLINLSRVDLGMNVDSLVTFRVSPRLNGYDPERAMTLYDRIEEELAAEPGVVAAAASLVPLIGNSSWGAGLSVEGFEGGPGVDTNAAMNFVSPSFFRTLEIPMLSGRGFTDADGLDRPRVAVVNESFVRKFGLGDDPLGKRFGGTLGPDRRFGSDGGPGQRDIEIVGVVADSSYSSVRGEIPPQFFMPRRQNDNLRAMSFYVRAGIEPAALTRTIRRVVADIDAELPVDGLMTMRSQIRANVFLDRLVAYLSAGFAGLATLLAAIGLYGVLAYNVAQRTRELGLRLALGAAPGNLRTMVLRQVGVMALVGGGIGLVAAIGFGRAAEALLFGLTGYDPLVLAGAVAVLAVVVTGAGYVPARRASNIAPMEALRHG